MRIPQMAVNSSLGSAGCICSSIVGRSQSRPRFWAWQYIPLVLSNRSFGSITIETVRIPLVKLFMNRDSILESARMSASSPYVMYCPLTSLSAGKPAGTEESCRRMSDRKRYVADHCVSNRLLASQAQARTHVVLSMVMGEA